MQRHAKTKFRKKGGAPFGMGLMNKRLHQRAHERMGMDGNDSTNEKTEVNDISAEIESKPGKAPENKKEK